MATSSLFHLVSALEMWIKTNYSEKDSQYLERGGHQFMWSSGCCVFPLCDTAEGPLMVCICKVQDMENTIAAQQLGLDFLPSAFDDHWVIWDTEMWGDSILYNPKTGKGGVLHTLIESAEEADEEETNEYRELHEV